MCVYILPNCCSCIIQLESHACIIIHCNIISWAELKITFLVLDSTSVKYKDINFYLALGLKILFLPFWFGAGLLYFLTKQQLMLQLFART